MSLPFAGCPLLPSGADVVEPWKKPWNRGLKRVNKNLPNNFTAKNWDLLHKCFYLFIQRVGNTDNSRVFSDKKHSWSRCFCTSKLSREWTWARWLCHVIIPALKSVGSMARVWLQLTNAPLDNAWMCCKASTCQDHEQQKVWVWTLCFVGIRKTSCKDTDCIMIMNVPDLFYLHRYSKWEET